jgi:hypothetical protein
MQVEECDNTCRLGLVMSGFQSRSPLTPDACRIARSQVTPGVVDVHADTADM